MCPLTTRLWCTGLLLPPILITLIPIRATFQGQLWRGARELRWGPLLGGLGAVPVARARELVQVEAELELAQVVVELAPGRVEVARRLGPVAVAPRTKSVTAAHHPDLVPLLAAEEDLAAAVAETTREPAAAEAV